MKRAWLAAGVVLFSGFGVLQIASPAGLGDAALPGLHTFRPATVGDAVLLPLLAFCLIRSSAPIRTRRTARRRVVAAAGVLGLLGGAATQVLWLTEPDQRALEALATHVRRQNVLALVALLPLGFFLLFNEITGFDRNGLKQILVVDEVLR